MFHRGGLASCDESGWGDEVVVLIFQEGLAVEAVQVYGGEMRGGWAVAEWMAASSDWFWRLAMFDVVLAVVNSSWQGPAVWRRFRWSNCFSHYGCVGEGCGGS